MAIFETIAVSMVSLATLVLTITMVVVQLAMGQFSPRIVQTFLQDRPSQLAIGLFVATFAHAMLAMREVQFDGDGQVPGLAIVVGLRPGADQHRHAGAVRAPHRAVAAGLGADRAGRHRHPDLLERHARTAISEPRSRRRTSIAAPHSGVLVGIDRERLVELAADADCVLHVVPGARGLRTGRGAAGAHRRRAGRASTGEACIDALRSGMERTLDEDLGYGFRLLVDMAERSLSDSEFLDPTTAVQCIDRLHDGLRQLATREIHDGRFRGADGQIRLTVPTMDWAAYVHLAFDEVRLAGATSPQIAVGCEPPSRTSSASRPLLDALPPSSAGTARQRCAAVVHGSCRTSGSRWGPTARGSGPPHLEM